MNRFFISVKWKAALLLSVLLLLFSGYFLFFTFWNSQQQLELSRHQVQQQHEHELLSELNTASNNIQHLVESTILPNASLSNRQYLFQITKRLQENQEIFENERQISIAQYIDNTGKKLAGWGAPIPPHIMQLLPTAVTDRTTQSFIDCNKGCKQFNVIPIFTKDYVRALFVTASTINSSLLSFTQKTNTDIAVLSRAYSQTSNSNSSRLISEWGMQVDVLTSVKNNKARLYALASQYTLQDLNSPQVLSDNNTYIEFNLIHSEQNKNLLFIIIDNISLQKQDLINTMYRNNTSSLIGIAVISLCLLLFLSSPLSRLRSISNILPLIAQQEYSDARALLEEQSKDPSRFKDEFSQIEQSVFDLTFQLESASSSLQTHADTLGKRSEELQQERDFVQSLINTAQMLIITTDERGNITSFNHFSENVTGHSANTVINTPIERLFPTNQRDETKSIFTRLKDKEQAISPQESEITHRDGTVRIISWLHSSLNHPTDDSVILSVGQDITEKKRSDEHIIWLAEHDVLTELYNRRKFNVSFEQALNNAKRFGHQGVLMFLDLDQFKDINDSYGHKMGDRVLKQVATTLLAISRTTDSVARLGGDEFAIILPETDEAGAINFAKKISEQLALMKIRFNNLSYKVTTSIGLVQFPLADQSIEELISNADLAMYQAKAKGKNTWHLFDMDDKTRVQLESRIFWKQRIENAFEKDRFVLHYQPIMDIKTETISHYEALVRMLDETDTLRLPESFIPIAEKTGLIQGLDHLVLRKSIEMQAELDQENKGISLSMNLSASAINDSTLLADLKKIIQETRVNPNNIIFEISESAAVNDLSQAKEFMGMLHQLGCNFSLDDFGTGFSSFHYLRDLPVDIVKIDGSFILNLVNNNDDQIFVKALVDVAKNMGKKTAAEFVQDAATLSLLKSLGVDYAQGYYIGRPEPYFLDKKALPVYPFVNRA